MWHTSLQMAHIVLSIIFQLFHCHGELSFGMFQLNFALSPFCISSSLQQSAPSKDHLIENLHIGDVNGLTAQEYHAK